MCSRWPQRPMLKEKGKVPDMKIEKSLMSGSNMLLILKLLSEKEMYGYEMIQTLAKRSQNAFEMKEGTLYPLLHELEKNKCVSCRITETPGGRQRKYYAITDKGMDLLKEKKEEWSFFSGKVNEVVFGAALPAVT